MPLRRTRSPRCLESPLVGAGCWAALTFVVCLVFFFLWVAGVETVGAPRPAPPLPPPVDALVDVLLVVPAAIAGAAATAAAMITAMNMAGARMHCVTRREAGYDKHNPFAFSRLRG